MTTTVLLRVAAVISLLFAAGHMLGGTRQWSPMGANQVLDAMTSVHFDVMGVSRSYLDFFMGFGWSLGVAMLLQSALLWQLAAFARTDASAIRPMLATFVLATLASTVIAWFFILPLPTIFSAVLLVVLIAAYMTARRPAK
jgi:hypothetical protein